MAAALERNGTSVTRNRSLSVSGTPISCTTSSAATMRPSMSFLPPIVYGALILWPVCKRNFTFDDVHEKGAERIAKVSASVGVPRLVHISHLNASPTSASQFYRTKAAGESAVREAFPAATIVRPGPMYGHEDKFLTNMSSTSPRPRSSPPLDTKHRTKPGRSGGSSTTARPSPVPSTCAPTHGFVTWPPPTDVFPR